MESITSRGGRNELKEANRNGKIIRGQNTTVGLILLPLYMARTRHDWRTDSKRRAACRKNEHIYFCSFSQTNTKKQEQEPVQRKIKGCCKRLEHTCAPLYRCEGGVAQNRGKPPKRKMLERHRSAQKNFRRQFFLGIGTGPLSLHKRRQFPTWYHTMRTVSGRYVTRPTLSLLIRAHPPLPPAPLHPLQLI